MSVVALTVVHCIADRAGACPDQVKFCPGVFPMPGVLPVPGLLPMPGTLPVPGVFPV